VVLLIRSILIEFLLPEESVEYYEQQINETPRDTREINEMSAIHNLLNTTNSATQYIVMLPLDTVLSCQSVQGNPATGSPKD
jgi:hypothetical protein